MVIDTVYAIEFSKHKFVDEGIVVEIRIWDASHRSTELLSTNHSSERRTGLFLISVAGIGFPMSTIFCCLVPNSV